MKKIHLVAATALLSAMLASGYAQAATTAAKDATPPKGAMMKSSAERQEMMAKMKPIHEAMTKMHEENKETFEKIEALQKELTAIVKADTFDKAAYVSKAGEIDALHQKIAAARAEAMAEGLSKMSAEDRKTMPEPMMGMRPHRGPMMMGKGPMGAMKGPGAPGPQAPAPETPDSEK